MATTDFSSTVVESITIDAPIAAVFAALAEPGQVASWWGAEDTYRVTKMTSEFRVGGTWESTGTLRDGKTFSVGGTYREIDPPHAIEFTWRYRWSSTPDGTAETVVRYDLSERDGATELCVTHSGFSDAADRDDHKTGWGTVLGWLRAFVENPLKRRA